MYPDLVRKAELSGAVHIDGDVAVVTLTGDIDLHTATDLTDYLATAMATGAPVVAVDMSGVTFMGAGALGIFLRNASRLEAVGRHVLIRAVPAHILRVFDVGGVSGKLGVHPMLPASLLENALVSIASTPPSRYVLDEALSMLVSMTKAVLRGADGASLTLPRGGQLQTVAASNDVVLAMDHDQYDTGQGPCLDAANQGERFVITSLESETRWPEFVPRARARGIESILSTPLVHDDQPLGALNVYSRTVDAFAQHETDWADQFAARAAALLVSAAPVESAEAALAGIQDALASRELIAVAQGMLMQRDGISLADAETSLMRLSAHTTKPLRQVAADLVGAKQPAPAARKATPDVSR